MDVLTDLIRMAVPDGRLFAQHAVHGEWGVRFPCDRSAGFHVILQGTAWLRGGSLAAPVRLERGDVVLVARGVHHDLASGPEQPALDVPAFHERPAGSGTPTATFVGAAYQFLADGPPHPFFAELPPLIHMAGAALPAHDPIHLAVALLSAELAEGRPGSQAVIERLVDVLFHYIVRAWIDQPRADVGTWAAALRDESLSRALAAMHHEPARAWDVAALAATGGLSRSAFAERFKRATGETPASYLAQLRVRQAMGLLRGSERGLEVIAADVGYANAFAFSKAFKRYTGTAPGAYRRQATGR